MDKLVPENASEIAHRLRESMGSAAFDETIKSLKEKISDPNFDPKETEQKYGISPDIMPEILKFVQQFWNYING